MTLFGSSMLGGHGPAAYRLFIWWDLCCQAGFAPPHYLPSTELHLKLLDNVPITYRSWPRPSTTPYTRGHSAWLPSSTQVFIVPGWLLESEGRKASVRDDGGFVKLQLMKGFLFSSQKQEQCSRESWLFRKTGQL